MERILDQFISGVIDGPGDLMGIGECLNLLDRLEGDERFPAGWSGSVTEIKRIFNRIILDESPDPGADWGRIRALAVHLVDGSNGRTAGAPPDPEADQAGFRDLMDDLCSDAATGDAVEDALEKGASPDNGSICVFEIQDPELLKDFIEEAREHLSSIELNMLALEANPGDLEAINSVFRPFHSIKGVAGFLNLQDIHHLSHEVENLLDAARSGQMVVTDALIDVVLTAADILKVLLVEVERVQNGEAAVPESSPLVQPFLDRVRNFDPDTALPGAPDRKVGQILVEQGALDEDMVETLAEKSRSSGMKIGEAAVLEGVATTRDVSKALREQRHTRESTASVRVDTQKLDNLVDMVGELVIAQTMVLQNPQVQSIKDQKLQKDSAQLGRITAELQRISMSMRMVPIKATFQKMIRLVRDLCKKSGKEIELVMNGEETEIDRNMVEEIYEPLVHMLRNSVDHGVEMPDERETAGKPRTGTIRIAAEQKGGNIVIDVQDDGRGLNAQKIRAKAVERGIISPEDRLDEKAIYELIMHPGFSTKDEVTEVSGRGVGMDVVKKSIERLRGKLEIMSTSGRGTHIQLKLPLTMAIIDGMIIQVGDERYVVPTISMRESLRPAKEAYLTVQGRGEMIKVRESLLPLIRLHELFGVEPRCRDPWEGLLLVVNEGNHSYGLLADEIVGRQEVVIKSLGGSLRHLLGISGGAILGDGRVALIIDIKGIISFYEETVQ